MNVIRIFEVAKKSLYAAQFEGEQLDALKKLQEDWTDPTVLKDFFNQYKQDYESFYGKVKINQKIRDTKNEADELLGLLYQYASSDEEGDLSDLFTPLENKEKEEGLAYNLQRLKAYGTSHRSYLRIYAVRFGDSYVITGGAIKLTDTMNTRPHTKLELLKMQLVSEFLGVKENESQFVYLDTKEHE